MFPSSSKWIFSLKHFLSKNITRLKKNICHISASCRGCGGCRRGCVFGRCPHHCSLGTETRTRGLQSAPTSAASTPRHTHTAGNSGDVMGEGSLNKSTTKAQNNFKVYRKVFHGWCFSFIMQFSFRLMRLTTILSLDMILNTLTQFMPLKYHF